MLLSSNVIHICVRLVMLVRMIRTHLFVAARVKSCPSMHSGCMIASLWLCSHSWSSSEFRGVTKGLIKGDYWPLTRERKSRLSIKFSEGADMEPSECEDVQPSEGEGV